ncbi:WGR domain-containing protein [Thiohalomonas denitrificans]|uniref:WGR domain-containing protein, predicted DNA-binding domain in MolR n=1 Tax=Thiohalomonas denitrificans TaxID=415747 RepID=A0A1G5QWW2_9GAMM|nr:WGR domain-containing protein [Thiohalomonas denitrificans]SCZ66242.1 WGR domain-containing protein, predicted DNA-binding domain in MolR [Thiohalomonas denitrificans]
MRIYLQTPVSDERPPRYYHLFLQEDLLEGWTLMREWGFQGSPGRIKRDHFVSYDSAEDALLKHRDNQLGRGYRVMFQQGEQPK